MAADCEHINPYRDDPRSKGMQVEAMFDNIAPAYDLMNRAMTLGLDRLWRRRAVRMLRARGTVNDILDVATGTGDLAMLMAERLDPVSVTGVDISERMLRIGRRKAGTSSQGDIVKFTLGDCLNLPFPDESFDCVTVAFGVRNFEDIARGYSEMYRVMRPGATLLVIELSVPTAAAVRPLYDLYTRRVIPMLGRAVSRDNRAYTYLPESIAAVPCGADMTALMQSVGFTDTAFRPMTFGVCTIYTASKPVE